MTTINYQELMNDEDVERFWKKVEKTESCWLWTGANTKKGYGRFKIKAKLHSPHRVSLSLSIGSICLDKQVCHKCDNPSCVRPDHLFEGTRSDNMKDAFSKGRLPGFTVHISRAGESSQNSKLTENQVREIKKRLANKEKASVIAKDYTIHERTISNIKLNKTWNSVTVEI